MKNTFCTLLLLSVLLPGAFCHAEEGPSPEMGLPPPPPPERPSPEMMQTRARFRHGPGLWRVFAHLSAQEKKDLRELQRKDPEKFRQLMQEKADTLFQREQQERKALHELAGRCRTCRDEKEKQKLTQELRTQIAGRFHARLQDHRQNLEENRRRLAMMEKELAKREANADAIIDAQLADMLAGVPPDPRKRSSAPRVERVPERIP